MDGVFDFLGNIGGIYRDIAIADIDKDRAVEEARLGFAPSHVSAQQAAVAQAQGQMALLNQVMLVGGALLGLYLLTR